MIVSHYDRPWGGHAKWEWCPQHSMKHFSRYQRVFVGPIVKVLGLSTSIASNHRNLVVGTEPTQISPYHHPWLLGWGSMQYGIIPTWTCGRNWQGPRNSEAQWVWLGMASHEWLVFWMDPHVHHAYQWCSPGNESFPCRRIIFRSCRRVGVFGGCAEPTGYAANVLPKYCCKWGCHPDTPVQNYWWMVVGYRLSSSWKWLDNFSNQRAWPTILKYLPLTWRWSSIHMHVLLGPSGSQISTHSYWGIWPPWSDQGGLQFGESGISLWLWFYSGPSNQCRVVRFHLSYVPAWLVSYKVMS